MKQFLALLLSILVFLLPIQSILGVFAVNRLGLPILTLLWKEVIILIIMGLLVRDLYYKLRQSSFTYILQKTWMLCLTCGISLFLIVSSIGKVPFANIFYGFRFELFWVFFFAVLYSWYQVADLETLELVRQKIVRAVYFGFVPVILISYLTLMIGQDKVLGFLGFGLDNTKLLSDIPVSHVVDGGGWNNLLRLAGTFTTPNHFAGYLLLILPFFAYRTIIERVTKKKLIFAFGVFNILLFIGLSFARFAWLALLSWILVLGAYYLIKHRLFQKILYITAFILPLFIGIVAINLPEEFLQTSLPSFISKPSSTVFHARRTFATLEVLIQRPNVLLAGYGLGASGPAAKDQYTPISENPLYKENIQTALRYFLEPVEITIPENWFIQLALNGGIIYAAIYSLIVLFVLGKLVLQLFQNQESTRVFEVFILLGFFSILIGNLFLHLWENQTVAIFYSLLILFIYKTRVGTLQK